MAIAARAMNNTERSAAKELKSLGFHVFWFESGSIQGAGYYATHIKLIYQYHIGSCFQQAISDLKEKVGSIQLQIL